MIRIGLLGILIALASLSFSQQGEPRRIDLEVENFNEFQIFNGKIDDYKVYFTGENHTYATFNTKFQFKLLKYLHEEQNVRHFIFEQSPAVGYIIEKVIIEDSQSYMNYLGDMFYGPFYELVKEVRDFNREQPDSGKIHMHGIDIERFPTFSLYTLARISEEMPSHRTGGEVFEQIKALESSEYQYGSARSFYAEEEDVFAFGFGDVSAWESVKSIIEGAEKYRDSLVTYLGDDSTIFYSILESMEVGREWYVAEKRGDIKSPIVRERYMVQEFESFYDPESDEKYYGQFGRCHLHRDQDAGRCYDYYMNSVANRINEMHESLENQVLVIPIFYYESRDFDRDVISDLAIPEAYLDNGFSYIFDLKAKGGQTDIVGFYDDLPFVIISNANDDRYEQAVDYWYEEVKQYHLGAYYGYHYFNKLDDLNNRMVALGSNAFTNKWLAYGGAFDYYTTGMFGVRYTFSYFPEASNGDRFSMRGYLATLGTYANFGRDYFSASLGYDIGFGSMKLIEQSDNNTPNLIQSEGLDKVVYRNDVFIFDPNLELRLSLPLISLNLRGGFNVDMSGKRWKLDQKINDFPKTSFSGAYIQAGVSLNLKVRD
ncbi:MAG: hypothetical protein MK078_08120 [Crocinitomicaceae bacterium]|nr:hypothetical protein [Crocinitomicaceae bacterium]